MVFSPLVVLLPVVVLAVAAPTDVSLHRRIDTSSHCGQWDTVTAGQYSLLLDQWGASGASSGSDCASFTSMNGNNVAWSTTYNWIGGNGIKSYTNMQVRANES
jgi:xyloglucan-specific endo-beta-1,4-glucanase